MRKYTGKETRARADIYYVMESEENSIWQRDSRCKVSEMIGKKGNLRGSYIAVCL